MRILHVIINLTSGGAELMLKRLTAEQSTDSRFEHQVISLVGLGSVGPLLEAQGVPVQALGMRRFLDVPRTFGRLVLEMRRRKPDVVQCWMYHADLMGGLAARIAGVKAVLWGVRIADIGPQTGVSKATRLIRSVCAALSTKVPDKIVYVANAAKEVHERLGYDPSRSIVIHNGYEQVALYDRARLRRELRLPADAIVLLSAGRFSTQKDPRTFVGAAGALARRFPKLHAVMIGRGYSPDNQRLAAWIDKLAEPEAFHLLGERSDLAELLPGADLFCLHSVSEGFPNVVAEAMRAGLPCVVTDVGDAPALVGETGLVVPPRNPSALAESLETVVAMPKKQRNQLGELARRRIQSEYSIEKISRLYAELYESLTANAPEPIGFESG